LWGFCGDLSIVADSLPCPALREAGMGHALGVAGGLKSLVRA
jgi:hypothetical protein